MWRAGSEPRPPAAGALRLADVNDLAIAYDRQAGFTLMELLVVMLLVAMTVTAVTSVYRAPSSGAQVKSAAMHVASRLRDLRSAAMQTGTQRLAEIDPTARVVRFSDGRTPLVLNRTLNIAVTAADTERTSAQTVGIRFYPNGSSSGATIKLISERQGYEVRVNWLTGRVSTAALR
jgi:general secretion pathway protein H